MNRGQKKFRKLAREAVKLYRNKKWSASITKWDEIISRLQDDLIKASVYTRRGNAKGNAGDHEDAIADYERAIELNPQYARAYSKRGVAKHHMGDLKGAITDYERAIELNPQYARAYSNRGVAKDNMGDPEGAIADYERAIELNPQDAIVYSNRGVVKDNMGDHKGAIADHDWAIELNPQYARAYSNRGIAKDNMGDYAGAIADYDQALKIDPEYKNARHNRTIALSMQRSQKKSLETEAKYQAQLQAQLQAQQEKFDRNMQEQLQAQQEKFDRERQEQLQKQEAQLQAQQEKIDARFEAEYKAAVDIAESMEYPKNFDDYDKKTEQLDKNAWWWSCALALAAAAVYGGIAYLAYAQWQGCDKPCEIEGYSAFSLLPFILMGTLLLSPLVWIIRMLNRDKNKCWALREDALANISLARIIKGNPTLRKELSERLFDHHDKRNNVSIIIDGNRADTDGGIFVSAQDIAKEFIKRFKSGDKGGGGNP